MSEAEGFEGKVVLVTGSSSGIGEGVARAFDAQGASVVVNSARSIEQGTLVANSLQSGIYVQGDISLDEDVARLVSTTLETFGRLDVLVNNAGTTQFIPHHDLAAASRDVWREIFEVNVFGTWAMTVAAVDALTASKGCVVNVTSIAGLRTRGSSIPYAASKAALNHQTVLLANVLGPDVRVNAVAPGLIDTPWTEDWEFVRDVVRNTAPMKRTGTPEDVGQMVLALAQNSYVTGQVVVIDGGLTII
jgi:ketoreductase RED2